MLHPAEHLVNAGVLGARREEPRIKIARQVVVNVKIGRPRKTKGLELCIVQPRGVLGLDVAGQLDQLLVLPPLDLSPPSLFHGGWYQWAAIKCGVWE